jgi:hypothetical protein
MHKKSTTGQSIKHWLQQLLPVYPAFVGLVQEQEHVPLHDQTHWEGLQQPLVKEAVGLF